MLGLVVIFLVSWILLTRLTGESILVLGISPNKQRLKEFSIAATFMAVVAVVNFVGQAYVKQIEYGMNPNYQWLDFVGGTFWIAKAVLFEELVFRGALLYLLIRWIGIVKACVISSIVFGIYHWFSYELFGGRVIVMVYIFLVTGCSGWMFAYAFAKTKSIYAPFGLHFGWNFVTAIVFSSGPIGNHLLIQQGQASVYSDWFTLVFFSLQALLAPGLVTWYLHTHYRARKSSG